MVVFWGRGFHYEEKNAAQRAPSTAGSALPILLQAVNVTQAFTSFFEEAHSLELDENMKIKQSSKSRLQPMLASFVDGASPMSSEKTKNLGLVVWHLADVLSEENLKQVKKKLLNEETFWKLEVSEAFQEALCQAREFPKNVKVIIYSAQDGETSANLTGEEALKRDVAAILPHEPKEGAHEIKLIKWKDHYDAIVDKTIVKMPGDGYCFYNAIAYHLARLLRDNKLNLVAPDSEFAQTLRACVPGIDDKTYSFDNKTISSASLKLREMTLTPEALKGDILRIPKDDFKTLWSKEMKTPTK